jgi:hypothetical protein
VTTPNPEMTMRRRLMLIFDCQLPIAEWIPVHSAIGNRQSAITCWSVP